MAKNRHTLAVSHLDKFKEWLSANGWQIQNTKGDYEVLRAVKAGLRYPLIVYRRCCTDNGNQLVHFSVLNRDMSIVRAFIKDIKENNNERD